MLASKCGVSEVETIPFGPVGLSFEVRKVLPWSKTDKKVKREDKLLEKKKRKKNIWLFFCTEYGCNGIFSSQLHLDQHRLSGAHDYSNRSTWKIWTTWNIHLQKRLSSRHISLLTQVILTQLYKWKTKKEQKKVGQSPDGKSSIIQKNRKAFWWNTMRKENKLVFKQHLNR